jgi:acetyltransferase
MVGLGGVYVELLEDVSFAVAPVRDWEAEEMLTNLKASKLLTGFRGQDGVDRDGIIEVIQRISQLVTEIPEIREIDLNPIIAHENGVTVVDARIGMKGG